MGCHRAGEVAPFALANYADAAKRAQQISDVTHARYMPPWRPEHNYGDFLGERRLTERQLEILAAWADADAPEGDADDLPPPPRYTDGWQLGEPDIVVKMPEAFTIPAEGRDVFRCFVLPLDVPADRLVAAVEFRPGNRKVVHHAIYFLDANGVARKKDEADPAPGYGSFGGPGFLPTGDLGGWSPGYQARFLPEDLGRYLKKGSDLVLQVHYHPSGKPETDQSSLGIHYVKKPSRKVVATITITNRNLYIEAGENHHEMSGTYTLPSDVRLVGVTPHMHLLGKEMKATATLPDGKTIPLIWIKNWNFNWQDQYILRQPLKLPKGTRIDVTAAYDNSPANPFNPSSPPRRVTWGEQTTDEMFFCFFPVTTDRAEDLMPLIIDNIFSLRNAGRRRNPPAESAQ